VTDRDAFLKAIREDLRNDQPRLVYADWLEERGEENRAAFIRLDIEMCRLTEQFNGGYVSKVDNAVRLSTLARESHRMMPRDFTMNVREPSRSVFKPESWDLPIVPTIANHPLTKQFEFHAQYNRGFMSHLRGPLEGLLKCGKGICQYELVKAVRVSDKRPIHLRSCGYICRRDGVTSEPHTIDWGLQYDFPIGKGDDLNWDRDRRTARNDAHINFATEDAARQWLDGRVGCEILPDSPYHGDRYERPA
jgi:uncharacterized protein (TIGR02996 family)